MLFSILIVLFFFKQKTAYEMRISDWSSDVCSSDLGERIIIHHRKTDLAAGQRREQRVGQAAIQRRDARSERECGIAAPRAGRGRADDAVLPAGQEAAEKQRATACQRDAYRVRRGAAAGETLFGLNRRIRRVSARDQSRDGDAAIAIGRDDRSEEHTSELQSLMRNS